MALDSHIALHDAAFVPRGFECLDDLSATVSTSLFGLFTVAGQSPPTGTNGLGKSIPLADATIHSEPWNGLQTH